MKILIVGGDGKGAWQMRGVQVGRALRARVTSHPSPKDLAWADLVVLVKRAAVKWGKHVKRVRVPVVWDALDFWDQPEENGTPLDQLIHQAAHIAQTAGVSLIVGATKAMASDLGGAYLPHHCRLGLQPIPPRSTARVVAYEGQVKYLGRWREALESSCRTLGLKLVVNPTTLSKADVLVSFRDGRWDGDICRRWKSGVKYVNAMVAGRPIISQSSSARSELMPIGPIVEQTADLAHALRQAISLDTREAAYESGRTRAAEFSVEAVAKHYAAILRSVQRRAA